MNNEQPTRRGRVLTRYNAEDRQRLIHEQAQSGLSMKAFCVQRKINLGTFYGWNRRQLPMKRQPAFAEVELSSSIPTAYEIEVLLPTGARVGIRHHGKRDDLVALIRGVSGC